MKSDYTTNSRYITHTIAFWKVGRIHFLSSGVNGLNRPKVNSYAVSRMGVRDCMDRYGWVHGLCWDAWVGGWASQWIDWWMSGWMEWSTDGWVGGWAHSGWITLGGWVSWSVDRLMDECVDGLIDCSILMVEWFLFLFLVAVLLGMS